MSLDALVSPYVGVVRLVDELLVSTCDPPLPRVCAELGSDERILGARLDPLGALGGVAASRDDARRAALGEAAERYSLSYLPPDRLVVASAAELGPDAVDPGRFALFTPEQHACEGFPFVPFEPETRVPWIDGLCVDTGEDAWLPAELVYLADSVAAGGTRIGYATTGGAACGTSFESALLRGLLELCERDAFVLAWTVGLSLPLLDWSRHRRLRELDERSFAPTGLAYAAVDLSSLHRLPCVLGVVRTPAPGPALAVGAAAAPTVERAWAKALAEAFSTHALARSLLERRPDAAFAPHGDDVVAFDDHVLFHALHEHAGAGRFLDAAADRVDIRDVPPLEGGDDAARIDALTRRIRDAGSSAYAVDATSPDLRTLGLHVVKTLAPELCMLDVPHRARFLGGGRLRVALAEARREPNPYPHPFP